jgi:hypothetical protein
MTRLDMEDLPIMERKIFGFALTRILHVKKESRCKRSHGLVSEENFECDNGTNQTSVYACVPSERSRESNCVESLVSDTTALPFSLYSTA